MEQASGLLSQGGRSSRITSNFFEGFENAEVCEREQGLAMGQKVEVVIASIGEDALQRLNGSRVVQLSKGGNDQRGQIFVLAVRGAERRCEWLHRPRITEVAERTSRGSAFSSLTVREEFNESPEVPGCQRALCAARGEHHGRGRRIF